MLHPIVALSSDQLFPPKKLAQFKQVFAFFTLHPRGMHFHLRLIREISLISEAARAAQHGWQWDQCLVLGKGAGACPGIRHAGMLLRRIGTAVSIGDVGSLNLSRFMASWAYASTEFKLLLIP